MRILCIDKNASALDWCLRCQEAGHEVRLFIKNDPKYGSIGEGLITKVKDFQPWLKWANLIVAYDNCLYIKALDDFRRSMPCYVVAPTEETTDWELDRIKGMKVLNDHGIDTPPYRGFNDYDEAIKYVAKEGKRFVSKPSGEADKALSYCAKSPDDMISQLMRWKKSEMKRRDFILQEFVEGIEMAVGGWFGPGGFNEGWCENFEFKKLMNGDLGVATGEQGTILRYVRASKLAAKVLNPLSSTLEELGYVGYIDVNCIIDSKGKPWPLEFTMRPGYPTIDIQCPLHTGDPAEWLLDLCKGKDAHNIEFNSISCGVVVTIPDYPYSHFTRKQVVDIPVYGMKNGMMDSIHLCEIKAGEAPYVVNGKVVMAPCLVTAGDHPLVVTGVAESVKDARQKAYGVIKKLVIPNSPMWRTDIGMRLSEQLPTLQAMGYARGLRFS